MEITNYSNNICVQKGKSTEEKETEEKQQELNAVRNTIDMKQKLKYKSPYFT